MYEAVQTTNNSVQTLYEAVQTLNNSVQTLYEAIHTMSETVQTLNNLVHTMSEAVYLKSERLNFSDIHRFPQAEKRSASFAFLPRNFGFDERGA